MEVINNMAKCRCAEISACQTKIERLIAVLSKLDSVDAHICEMNVGICKISELCPTAVSSKWEEESNMTIMEVDDELIAVRTAIKCKIKEKKKELVAELAKMSKEDVQYHEECREINERL